MNFPRRNSSSRRCSGRSVGRQVVVTDGASSPPKGSPRCGAPPCPGRGQSPRWRSEGSPTVASRPEGRGEGRQDRTAGVEVRVGRWRTIAFVGVLDGGELVKRPTLSDVLPHERRQSRGGRR